MLKVHVHTTKLFWPATCHHGLATSVGRRCVDADDARRTHSTVRMRGTVNWWAGRFTARGRFSLRVGHRLVTLVDSTRESILALRCNFWCLQGAQSWPR